MKHWRNWTHRHYMRDFSSGADWRYCVEPVWDNEQKKLVKCRFEDKKAGSMRSRPHNWVSLAILVIFLYACAFSGAWLGEQFLR